MPQINQLPDVLNSQLFWLLLVFGLLYFGIARTLVPKVRSVIDDRAQRISDEIAKAEAARASAESERIAWELQLEKARADAAAVAEQARRAAARESEAMVAAAVAQINARVAAAEQNIRNAASDIEAELVGVAAEAAQELVQRLTGTTVSKQDALAAVTAELERRAGSSSFGAKDRGEGVVPFQTAAAG